MFWLRVPSENSSEVGAVMRANMDGDSVKTLVKDLSRPTSLALDPVKKVVYWIDSCLNVIRGTDYKGSYVRTLHTWSDRVST